MRERRSWVFIVFAILLVVGVAVFFWWRSYTASPRYALGKVASAAADGDWSTFQRYVAVSEISSDIANQIIEQRLGDSADEGVLGSLVDAAQPVLAQEVERELKAAVESRQGGASTRERIGAFFYTSSPKEISVRGNQAFVTVDVPYKGVVRELELQLRKGDDQWRVVRVMNIEELMQQR